MNVNPYNPASHHAVLESTESEHLTTKILGGKSDCVISNSQLLVAVIGRSITDIQSSASSHLPAYLSKAKSGIYSWGEGEERALMRGYELALKPFGGILSFSRLSIPAELMRS